MKGKYVSQTHESWVHLGTKCGSALFAVEAMAASNVEGHDHSIAFLEKGHTRADFL